MTRTEETIIKTVGEESHQNTLLKEKNQAEEIIMKDLDPTPNQPKDHNAATKIDRDLDPMIDKNQTIINLKEIIQIGTTSGRMMDGEGMAPINQIMLAIHLVNKLNNTKLQKEVSIFLSY